MSAETIILFIITDFLFCLSPGPAVLVTVSHAIGGGFRGSFGPIAGINAGNFIWYAITAAGLLTLLESSETAFTFIRWAGVGYLLWLGVRMILSKEQDVKARSGTRANFTKGFMSGLAVHMANPKAMLFYGAFLPQFINPDGNVPLQISILAIITVFTETFALSGYAWIAARAAKLTIRAGSIQWIDRISGGVLITAAIGLAMLKPLKG